MGKYVGLQLGGLHLSINHVLLGHFTSLEVHGAHEEVPNKVFCTSEVIRLLDNWIYWPLYGLNQLFRLKMCKKMGLDTDFGV